MLSNIQKKKIIYIGFMIYYKFFSSFFQTTNLIFFIQIFVWQND